MGFKIAWVAVKGKPLETVLRDLDLARTGEYEEVPEAEYCTVTMPNGWILILNNYASGDFIFKKQLGRVKGGAEVLTAYINESTMMSSIAGFQDGSEVWSTTHDCEHGLDHLEVTGTPPALFAPVRDSLQAQRHDAPDDGDFLFTLAEEVGEAITGFHHAKDIIGLGETPFELLEPTRVMAAARRGEASLKGWRKIFGWKQ